MICYLLIRVLSFFLLLVACLQLVAYPVGVILTFGDPEIAEVFSLPKVLLMQQIHFSSNIIDEISLPNLRASPLSL